MCLDIGNIHRNAHSGSQYDASHFLPNIIDMNIPKASFSPHMPGRQFIRWLYKWSDEMKPLFPNVPYFKILRIDGLLRRTPGSSVVAKFRSGGPKAEFISCLRSDAIGCDSTGSKWMPLTATENRPTGIDTSCEPQLFENHNFQPVARFYGCPTRINSAV